MGASSSGADSSHGRQRVRYLYDLDYLRKRAVGQNDPDIYYLGLRGRRYVAAAGLCSRALADRVCGVAGDAAEAPSLMMAHELTLSQLYVEARLEAARCGWELTWKNARVLEMERLGVQPDAWLEVRSTADARDAFLEFTAAMPSAAELAGKLAGYRALWERTARLCAVLWLTTSRAKADRLLEGVHGSDYRDCFLVGLVEDAPGFLTRPMWHWGDGDDARPNAMVRWLQPPEGVEG